jgi:GT2 family glycosyltransferase
MSTRDRREEALSSLARLAALPDAPPLVVVDDASRDGTAEAVRDRFPGAVEIIVLLESRGAAARTAGVARARTPYVAFADDDSWYAPGALARAAWLMDSHPRMGLLAARVLVGDDERLDATCRAMAASPLCPRRPLPGPAVLGFLACGAVVRRDAYLQVGGFEGRYGVGGEESLLAMDLAAAGWDLAYVEAVVAHHHPAGGGRRPGRRAAQLRNDLWTAWLRRPAGTAVRRSVALATAAAREPRTLAAGTARALAGLPWVLRERRALPDHVEAQARAVQGLEAWT